MAALIRYDTNRGSDDAFVVVVRTRREEAR
jgi:hypothetical protein